MAQSAGRALVRAGKVLVPPSALGLLLEQGVRHRGWEVMDSVFSAADWGARLEPWVRALEAVLVFLTAQTILLGLWWIAKCRRGF